jgi:hypothetical protein
LTASYALNGGSGGAGFPFTGSAQITGSLSITGSQTIEEGTLTIIAPNSYVTGYADGYTVNGIAIDLKGDQIITGSLTLDTDGTLTSDYVDIRKVMQLSNIHPLPTPELGMLAVSASNLYFSNGATWSKIN